MCVNVFRRRYTELCVQEDDSVYNYKDIVMIKRKDGFSGERAVILPQFIVREMEKDPISACLHITDIGYYPKAQYHFMYRSEPISQYVFIYCY